MPNVIRTVVTVGLYNSGFALKLVARQVCEVEQVVVQEGLAALLSNLSDVLPEANSVSHDGRSDQFEGETVVDYLGIDSESQDLEASEKGAEFNLEVGFTFLGCRLKRLGDNL